MTGKSFDRSAALKQAFALHRAGRLPEVEETCRRILEAEPGDADALTLLGASLQGQGDIEGAVTAFGQAANRKPGEAGALNNLGNILLLAGRGEEARAAYGRALEIDPRDAAVHNNLGNLLQDEGELEKALAAYGRAVEIRAREPQFHNNRALALQKLQRFDEAAAAARRAISIDPTHGAAQRTLGDAMKALGRDDEALAAYGRAAESDAGDHYSDFMVKALSGQTCDAPPPEYVVGLFDHYAEHFEREVTEELGYRVPERLRGMVGEVLGAPAPGWRVLDLGCGTGLCGVQFRDLASHLIGVDLSPRMVDKSGERAVYDDVNCEDLLTALDRERNSVDLIVAADLFIYVGALEAVFRACASALRPGGLLAFSVEDAEGDGFVLRPTARYAHSAAYIEALAVAAGLRTLAKAPAVIRKGPDGPIPGHLYVQKADHG